MKITQLTQLKKLRREEKDSGFQYPGKLVAVVIYEENSSDLLQEPKMQE